MVIRKNIFCIVLSQVNTIDKVVRPTFQFNCVCFVVAFYEWLFVFVFLVCVFQMRAFACHEGRGECCVIFV